MGRRKSKIGNQLIEAFVIVFVQIAIEIFNGIMKMVSSSPRKVEAKNKTRDSFRSTSTNSDNTHFNRTRIRETCSACGAAIKSNSPYCPKCLIIVNPELVDKTIIADENVRPHNNFRRTIVVKKDDEIQKKSLKPEDREIICRSCGSKIKLGSTYCLDCKTIVPLEDILLKVEEDLRIKDDAQEIINKNLQRPTVIKIDNEVQTKIPKAECIQPLSELFEDIPEGSQEFYESPVAIESKNNPPELKNTISSFETLKPQIIEEIKTEKSILSLDWPRIGESTQIGDFTTKEQVLKSKTVHPSFEVWINLTKIKTPINETIIVQISELATILGIEKRRLFSTSAQSETISSAASEFGYLLIPDYKMSGIPYKWKDNVALIPLPDKRVHSGATTEVFGINVAIKPTSENIYLSKNFQKVSLIFEMAYAIAASDGKVTEQEEAFLYKYIIARYELTPFDVKCIRALQNILQIQSLSLTEIGKRLVQHLDTEQKKVAVATFFGDIVLIDKKFEKQEERTLKKVFKSLEIDSSVATGIIKNLLIDQSNEKPTLIKKQMQTRKGEVLLRTHKQSKISIDENKLKKTMEDTLAVKKILDSIFEQEQDVSDIKNSPTLELTADSGVTDLMGNRGSLPFPPECITSLDVKYLPILNEIMISNKLSKIEFANMVKKHHLMPQAAFEEINSWADEELGDFLLVDHEDHITINFKS
jgi:uncharacterized tellurite resistance protein B-like protein